MLLNLPMALLVYLGAAIPPPSHPTPTLPLPLQIKSPQGRSRVLTLASSSFLPSRYTLLFLLHTPGLCKIPAACPRGFMPFDHCAQHYRRYLSIWYCLYINPKFRETLSSFQLAQVLRAKAAREKLLDNSAHSSRSNTSTSFL